MFFVFSAIFLHEFWESSYSPKLSESMYNNIFTITTTYYDTTKQSLSEDGIVELDQEINIATYL